MIQGLEFVNLIKTFFDFLIVEFNFEFESEKLVGSFYYELRFKKSDIIISVSYENVEDVYNVIIYKLHNGRMPDYDDMKQILHLSDCFRKISPSLVKEEFDLNNKRFLELTKNTELERKVLKSVKELRLVLLHNLFS